jgi:hypothetical protein
LADVGILLRRFRAADRYDPSGHVALRAKVVPNFGAKVSAERGAHGVVVEIGSIIHRFITQVLRGDLQGIAVRLTRRFKVSIGRKQKHPQS